MNFNALNGVETKEFILNKVREGLEESGEFRQNITFPWFRFEFSLKLTSLAGKADAPVPAEEKKLSVSQEVWPLQLASDPDFVKGPTEVVEFLGGGEVAVPDEARIESGQAIHVEEETDAGVKVDRPKHIKRAARAPWLKEGEE